MTFGELSRAVVGVEALKEEPPQDDQGREQALIEALTRGGDEFSHQAGREEPLKQREHFARFARDNGLGRRGGWHFGLREREYFI